MKIYKITFKEQRNSITDCAYVSAPNFAKAELVVEEKFIGFEILSINFLGHCIVYSPLSETLDKDLELLGKF
jgi:hypothetical protein